jgi:hypothetical protein
MVIDGHTHFLRDDTRLMGFVASREAVGQFGWNKAVSAKQQTIDDLNIVITPKKYLLTQCPQPSFTAGCRLASDINVGQLQ